MVDDRYSTVHIDPRSSGEGESSPGREEVTFTLVIWSGPAAQKEHFEQMLAEAETEMPDFRGGGTPHWTDTVTTRGQVAPDTSAYVVDQLTLPIPNPWDRNVRVVVVDFFEDNRAAVVSF